MMLLEKVTAFEYGHFWCRIVKFPGVYQTSSSSRVAAKYIPFQQKGNGRCALSIFEGPTIHCHVGLPEGMTLDLTHMSCVFAPVNYIV